MCVFEILEREKSKDKVPGLIQLLCVVIGFSVLMMVEILCKSYCYEILIKFSIALVPILNQFLKTSFHIFKFQLQMTMAMETML